MSASPFRPPIVRQYPAPAQCIDLQCSSANVPEGAILVVDPNVDDGVMLPTGADVATGVMGLALLGGAADGLHTITVLFAGPYLAIASGSITRGNQVTVANATGAVKAVSASTVAGAAIVGTALESATDGQRVLIMLSPENSAIGASNPQDGVYHTVRGVVTSNVAALGAFASVAGGTIVDGVTYAAGDRVLLAGQTTAKQNGIYTVGAVAAGTAPLTRAGDFATGATLPAATLIGVSEGIANANSTWRLTTAGSALVVDTSSLAFLPISGGQAGAFHSVRGVVTVNASLTAFASVAGGTIQDGVTYAQGDRVLLIAQTSVPQNGVYVVGAVAGGVAPLQRAADYATGATLPAETYVSVSEGTVHQHSLYRANSAGSAQAIDTASITFAMVYDAAQEVFRARCVSVAAVTLASGLVAGQTIDGVVLVAGDRVLLVAQGTAAQNGLYMAVAAGTGAFAPEWANGQVKASCTVQVSEGTVWHANSEWKATAAQASTGGFYNVGTTDPLFYPRTQWASGAVGTQVTNLFAISADCPRTAFDTTATAIVRATVGAGRGNGTLDFLGTGTDVIKWSVSNW